ncbi:Undecaprenyl diphosphate synthase [Cystobasidium minutum MCA 4210]|uniref:Undecaprenyl diphosphate synthase n=1 Tax=Cystobasidium minutum MCA 4210 TaxID=1397322 RepID=UPI0034CF2690|eukprot:jgi/Rhomi1/192317/gm1.531_g
MIQRCQRLIGGLLAFLVLLCLHLIHSTTLILALILHLIHHFRLSLHGSGSHSSDDTTTTTSTYATTRRRFGLKEEDITLWKAKKVPKCLGIIFVPPARGYFSLRHLKYKAYENESVYLGMQDDAIRLVGWAVELGIEELLLYDENGIFKRHSSQLQSAIQSNYASTSSSSRSASPSSVSNPSDLTTFVLRDHKLRIRLLSREDGKEHLATVTRGIAKGVQSGFILKDEIDVDYVQEKLYSSLCPEPDLLIVLGGLHLRLRGFPPWHTRLSEI